MGPDPVRLGMPSRLASAAAICRDRHERLLAYVWVGNLFVNAELAGAGYAEVVTTPPNVQHRDVLMARQREARQANRGLWADAEAFLYHRPRPSGVFGNTRLRIYFHPDDNARMILLADPFLYFESPQQAESASPQTLVLSAEPIYARSLDKGPVGVSPARP